MQTIDESRLETDLQYRYEYLAEFTGFTAADATLIQSFAPHLGPQIGALVEETYDTLLQYDATARHFVPQQTGCEGDAPADVNALTADHPRIRFRKDHLNRYFMQLIGRSYDAKMVMYLDMVGRIHTPGAGNSSIAVPLVQMNALMGLLSDALLRLVAQSPLDDARKLQTQLAFNKLLWIQNDLISRHYVRAGQDNEQSG
jgi:hypothetical protein